MPTPSRCALLLCLRSMPPSRERECAGESKACQQVRLGSVQLVGHSALCLRGCGATSGVNCKADEPPRGVYIGLYARHIHRIHLACGSTTPSSAKFHGTNKQTNQISRNKHTNKQTKADSPRLWVDSCCRQLCFGQLRREEGLRGLPGCEVRIGATCKAAELNTERRSDCTTRIPPSRCVDDACGEEADRSD